MAKIALMIGFGVLGALTGGLGWFGIAATAGHALLGFTLGMTAGQILGGVAFPMHMPNQYGPRLGDLTVSTATNGAILPIGYGTQKLAGNIIWSPGLVEHKKVTKQSAKGGPSYTSTTYTYTASWAIAFGESGGVDRIGVIKKIWFDTKVIYDNTGGGHTSKYPAPTLYNGSQTQDPDPVIQAAEGVDNTPAYRGLIYFRVEDFHLANFGNRIPSTTALIDYDQDNSHGLDQRVTDICRRSGIPSADIDVTQLEDQDITGYLISGMSDGKSALQVLMGAYFVDAVESDFKLKFVPRGVNDPVLTIPEADLGLSTDGAKLTEQFTQEQELPREVEVLFVDAAANYEQNKSLMQRSSRVVTTRQKVTISLPLVLTPDEARQIAEKALYLAWLEGRPFNFNLWKAAYLVLDPTDVVSFVYQGLTYTMRINSVNTGAGYSVEVSGVSEDQNNYVSTAVGGSADGFPIMLPDPPAGTLLYLFDIPYLLDMDAVADRSSTGFYWGFSSAEGGWPGAVLDRSPDDANFADIASSPDRMFYGAVTGTLPDPPTDPWSWDDDTTLTVVMSYGELSSSTDAAVLNGDNPLMVGKELIQYVNAVLVSPNTYELSRLLRGRRNTEAYAYGHSADEVVIDPNTGLRRMPAPMSLVGQLRYYRGITIGREITDFTSQSLTLAAVDLMPASPVHLTGARDGGNNLTIGWTRRTRYAGDWLNNTGSVPLNEDSEAYSIDILSGVTVVRTIAWTGTYDGDGNPTVAYSAADQTSDGLTPGNPVDMKIYQLSAQVGRGFPGAGTV